ncbi:hypothetical protein [Flavobacterium pectinovorum]|uniref:Uncharacterized protein n=1 Tax=Flavobacterium pectinovorum TaxID=29533 RepID=A0A502EN19_9FLAO|nr:hypothetical protein [Flavobacterium pectinovorum]TPG38474.1 hypothetical protein EAH81_16270 [Flavobacterium pectinovorum]
MKTSKTKYYNKNFMAENIVEWQEKRKIYLAVAIISFLIGTYYFIQVNSKNYIIKPSELQVYENLIISAGPKFKETKGKHSRRWIEFQCVNNRSTFEIASYDYRCIKDDDILNGIKVGDTISIAVLKNDITDFDTETSCEIHSLIKNNKEYLDMQCRNREDNNDGKMGFIILFAIFIMTGIVYSFSKKPIFFDHVDPRVPIFIVIIVLYFMLQ